MKATGPIRKMEATFDSPVSYCLPVGGESVPLNPHLGRKLLLRYLGAITCIHCGRSTSKSFNQGYCYPCFTRLAQCDLCIVKPERCHFHLGTCREPEWGEANCMVRHSVYLANSSGLKVGISRGEHPVTRWIDQGASQALVIRLVPSRLQAGRFEAALRAHVSDRTDWRQMLRGDPPALNLDNERDRILDLHGKGEPASGLPGEPASAARPVSIAYPVLSHPARPRSFNLDRSPIAQGTLQGIKGQYLIFDTGVINLRKYAGYEIELEVLE
jgi:hypothetical protein